MSTQFETVGHRERREAKERLVAVQQLREAGRGELAEAVRCGEAAVPEATERETDD